MAQVITKSSATVLRDCHSLRVAGSEKRVHLRQGTRIELTHKYQHAYYGKTEDGEAVWLEEDDIEIVFPPKSPKQSRKRSPSSPQAPVQDPQTNLVVARAVYKFDARARKVPGGLSMEKGERMEIKGQEGSWYFGTNLQTKESGIFPMNFVILEGDNDAEREDEAQVSSKPRTTTAAATTRRQRDESDSGSSSSEESSSVFLSESVADSPHDSDDSDSEEEESEESSDEYSEEESHSSEKESESHLEVEENEKASITPVKQAERQEKNKEDEKEDHVKPLRVLCEEFIASQGNVDPITKAVMKNFRSHCSRSFALVVLREFQKRRMINEHNAFKMKREFLHQIEVEHSMLLDEIDRLSGNQAFLDYEKKIEQLHAQLEERDRTIEAYHGRTRELQQRLAQHENQEWLQRELAFLDNKQKTLQRRHSAIE